MDPHQVASASLHDDLADTGQQRRSDEEKAIGSSDGEKNVAIINVNELGGAEIEPQQTNTSLYTYPEGGFRAWLVVFGAWLSMFSVMGLMNSIAIFQAYTVKHQLKQYSDGTVGWIFSIYTFLAFFGGVYTGPVFDKYGPTWLLVAGILLTIVGLIATSFCHELWHFILAFGVVCGLGTSLVFTPCIAAIGHWFKARRGLATGLACSAGGFGGIVFPLMLSSLFDRIGFGWSVRVLALICVCCGVPGICLTRSRLPPIDNASAHPDFRIFKQIPFLLMTIGLFLVEFSLFIPLAYISTYAQDKGYSQAFAFQLLPIMNAGSVIGRALPGYYADKLGAFNVCCFSAVLSLFGCLVIWLPFGHTKPGIIVFSLCFGFSSGNSIAIAPVCVGRLCRTQMYGRYYATCYTLVSVACLIGIPIAGAILTAEGGSYTGLIIFTGVLYVAATVVIISAKVCHLGWDKLLAPY